MANGDYGKFVFTRAWLFKDAFRRILIENDQKISSSLLFRLFKKIGSQTEM